MTLCIFPVERPRQDNNIVTLEMLHLQVSLRTGEQICLEKNEYTHYKMFFPLSNKAIIKRFAPLNFDDTQNIFCIDMIIGGYPFFSYLSYSIYLAAVDMGFEPTPLRPLEECSWYGKKWQEASLLGQEYIFKSDRNLDIIDPKTLSRIDENGFYIKEA